MNKKEIAEIKKQFKFENESFTIWGFGVYFIRSFKVESGEFKKFADLNECEAGISGNASWNELEETCFLDIIKKTFGGSLGKSLVEYNFPNDVMLDKKSQYQKLNEVLNNFTDKNILKYAQFLASKISFESEYALLISKSSYSVPQKNVNGEKMDLEFYEGDEYDFLTVSLCPVANSKPILMVDGTDDSIKHQPIQRVFSAPAEGFVYPTFNERATDVNSVLVFNKKPKEPCKTLIEDCLGCVYELNPDDELVKFNNLVNKIVDKESVDYDITKNIHENISSLIKNTSVNTEITELNSNDVKTIFENSGIDKENLDNFDEIYQEEVGDYSLKAVNLVENNKMNIKSPDIVINAKNNSLDRISSKMVDGKKCLVIEFDEDIEINGLKVNV